MIIPESETMKSRALILIAFIALIVPTLHAQAAPEAIKQELDKQAEDWNRGDVNAFMQTYKDAPDTTFIGKIIQQGYQKILERYQHAYPNQAAMGKLDFSEIDVRMLGDKHAVVTGHFHLSRTTEGGGDARGIFSLVFEKEPEGWRIILDHTTQTT